MNSSVPSADTINCYVYVTHVEHYFRLISCYAHFIGALSETDPNLQWTKLNRADIGLITFSEIISPWQIIQSCLVSNTISITFRFRSRRTCIFFSFVIYSKTVDSFLNVKSMQISIRVQWICQLNGLEFTTESDLYVSRWSATGFTAFLWGVSRFSLAYTSKFLSFNNCVPLNIPTNLTDFDHYM